MREIEGKALKNIVQYGFKSVLDLLIPRTCIVCKRVLDISEKHLCRECHDDIPHTYYWMRKFNPMADRFNALIQEEWVSRIAGHGIGTPPCREDYAYATALYFYRADSGYNQISRQVKYQGNIPAGRYFGQLLGERLTQAEYLSDVDAVIPVPLHWTRKWSRGYNQAEVIAREVATALGAELRTDILERRRRTRTQTKLTIEGKAANVKGAFRVLPGVSDHAGPKHLLLIDDVFTTGSTLHACYTALREVFPPHVRISVVTLGFVGET